MATYFDGEKLDAVTNINFDNATGDAYTAPSTRYTIVNFSYIGAGTRNMDVTEPDGSTVMYSIATSTLNPVEDGNLELFLQPGQKIKAGTGSGSLQIVATAREFLAP